MKMNIVQYLIVIYSLSTMVLNSAWACSRILVKNKYGVLVGRTMDWSDSWLTKHKIITMPAGIKRHGHTTINPLQWTSKYNSLVVTIYDIGVVEGMNNKGLGASLLYLPPSDYGQRDPSRKGLFAGIWTQFFLDNFSTVKEAVDYLKKSNIQVVTITLPGFSEPSGLHISLQDKTGDSAIVEYKKGKLEIYHDPKYTVLTNQPFFDEQLANLKRYKGYGGELAIPGGSNPKDRFVRATYYSNLALKDPVSEHENRKMVMGLLMNVSQLVIEKTDPKATAETSRTNYSSITDLTHLKFYFSMSIFHNLVSVDMNKINFSKNAPYMMFDVQNMDVHGEISNRFTEMQKPFTFLRESDFKKEQQGTPLKTRNVG